MMQRQRKYESLIVNLKTSLAAAFGHASRLKESCMQRQSPVGRAVRPGRERVDPKDARSGGVLGIAGVQAVQAEPMRTRQAM